VGTCLFLYYLLSEDQSIPLFVCDLRIKKQIFIQKFYKNFMKIHSKKSFSLGNSYFIVYIDKKNSIIIF